MDATRCFHFMRRHHIASMLLLLVACVYLSIFHFTRLQIEYVQIPRRESTATFFTYTSSHMRNTNACHAVCLDRLYLSIESPLLCPHMTIRKAFHLSLPILSMRAVILFESLWLMALSSLFSLGIIIVSNSNVSLESVKHDIVSGALSGGHTHAEQNSIGQDFV